MQRCRKIWNEERREYDKTVFTLDSEVKEEEMPVMLPVLRVLRRVQYIGLRKENDMRIPTIKMNLKKYREYNENGVFVQDSNNLKKLVEDTYEFGGFVLDEMNAFVGGFEWAYKEWLERKENA